jgi:heterodisulfide reductase subunit C
MSNQLVLKLFGGARTNAASGGDVPAAVGRREAAALPTRPLVYEADKARDFTRAVGKRSGQNVFACYQCRRCAAGCPVSEDTGGVTPDVLIRMVALGDEQRAFSNELVWKCLSCNTCGTRCPNSINTGRVVEALKKMAKEAGVQPLRPEVLHFHTSCYNDSLRWGRVSEMGLMGEYQLRNLLENLRQKKFKAIADEISAQTKFAFEMLRLGRLHLFFHTSKGRIEMRRLLKSSTEHKWS